MDSYRRIAAPPAGPHGRGAPAPAPSGGMPFDVPWEAEFATGRLRWGDVAGAAAAFRRDPAGVVGTLAWWESCLHPADRSRVAKSLARAVTGSGETWSSEYRFARGDDTYGWFIDRAFIVRDADGTALRAIGAMVGVTDRRESEAALQEATERYRTFVELSPDGIVRMEFDGVVRVDGPPAAAAARLMRHGRLAECNAAFAAMLGADDPAELVGSPLAGLQARVPGVVEDPLDRFLRGGCRLVDQPVETAAGRHFLLGAVGTVEAGVLRRVWGTLRDVTRLREMEVRLAAVHRAEAVGRLAGGVAHDFNNILTVIRGCAEMLLLDVPPGNPQEEDVQEIVRAADRASTLTRQLLAFSGRQVLKPEVVDLDDVVRGIAPILHRLVPASVRVRVHAAGTAAPVRVDAGQIGQVIVDLAVHAAERMTEGGVLEMEIHPAEVRGEDGGRAFPAYVAPGSYQALRFRDTAPPLDAATLAHLFDPFFTADPSARRGSGLGLSAVYGITKQSGGYVWAESRSGEGNTYTVLLGDAKAPAHPAAAQAAAPEGGGGTVLVVEDEPGVRSLALRILTRAGFDAIAAETPEDALRLAAALPGGLDLLLTDVVMPGLSGPALARRLRETRPEVPVLYMSGYSPEAVERHGALEPGTQLLQKPFSAPELADAVRRAVAAGRARREAGGRS